MPASGQTSKAGRTYFGFDRNEYPGDNLLPALRRSFSYTGYWLNNPPEASSNGWAGKRAILKAGGFGFIILYNGRLDAQLTGKDPAALGRSDAATAISAAKREGFAPGAILFLDQEEGGRLLPEQSAYLFAWVEAVRASQYKPGVYCSGILVPDGSSTISTARDILSHVGKRPLALWVANDACPPAPECSRRSLLLPLQAELRMRWFGSTRNRPAGSLPANVRRPMPPITPVTRPARHTVRRPSWTLTCPRLRILRVRGRCRPGVRDFPKKVRDKRDKSQVDNKSFLINDL